MPSSFIIRTNCFALLLLVSFAVTVYSQEKPKPVAVKNKAPVPIADEPKTIDPAKLMPKALSTLVTANFDNSSLREVVAWLQKEQKLTVLLDKKALNDEGIALGEPVTDSLNNEPLYLLLNRLQSLDLAWYMEDDIVYITTIIDAEEQMSTKPYKLGDMLDAGFSHQKIIQALSLTGGSWLEESGDGGSTEWLGDVLFVRQTDQIHRRVSGMLTALRKHGRRTFILDPPIHRKLKEKLNENISIRYRDFPLVGAIREIAEKTKIDIRLDIPALRDEGIRDREPVSLILNDRKLSTVLHVLLADLSLTWVLRDGVMWITTTVKAEEDLKTAVFDVRDLCQDYAESSALMDAIMSQTTQGPWEEVEGTGGSLISLKPGILIIRHTERNLDDVSHLLEVYRKALRESKPRKPKQDNSKKELTYYYRLNANIADDLVKLLPQLVQPETWKTEKKPAAIGTILKIASEPELLNSQGQVVAESKKAGNNAAAATLVVSRSVLIIQQTRAAHLEIIEVIRRIESGDSAAGILPTDQGLGGSQGGFGGGFFRVR